MLCGSIVMNSLDIMRVDRYSIPSKSNTTNKNLKQVEAYNHGELLERYAIP